MVGANEGPVRIVLASGSPRRRELLALLGVSFETIPSMLDEDLSPGPGESPEQFAMRLAWQKAIAVAEFHPDDLVLAADTLVIVDDLVLKKPSGAEEAMAMLRSLRGRTHRVITAVFMVRLTAGLQVGGFDTSTVTLREYSEEEISSYVSTGNSLDKAGAYGIQDETFRPARVTDGCYYNVVGLPCCVTARLLMRAGVDIVVQWFPVLEPCRRAQCDLPG